MNAAGHLDYILFVEGFSFVIFAVMAWRLPDKEPGDLPWHCLTWFGLLHGMYEWLHMCTVGLGESDVFAVFRFAVMAASFLPLAELGRRGLSRIGRTHVGPWVFLPFCILGALGAIHGLDGVNAAWQYALALPVRPLRDG